MLPGLQTAGNYASDPSMPRTTDQSPPYALSLPPTPYALRSTAAAHGIHMKRGTVIQPRAVPENVQNCGNSLVARKHVRRGVEELKRLEVSSCKDSRQTLDGDGAALLSRPSLFSSAMHFPVTRAL